MRGSHGGRALDPSYMLSKCRAASSGPVVCGSLAHDFRERGPSAFDSTDCASDSYEDPIGLG